MTADAAPQGLAADAASLFAKSDDAGLAELLTNVPDLSSIPLQVIEAAVVAAAHAGKLSVALRLYAHVRERGRKGQVPAPLLDLLKTDGQTALACDLVQQSQIDGDTPQPYLQRATALERLGERHAAMAELQRALSRFPKAPLVAQHLARLALEGSDRPAALAAVRLALDLSPEKPLWLRRAMRALTDERIGLEGIDLWVPADVVAASLLGPMSHGRYESQECGFLRTDLRPGDRMLDLGAGIGLVSLVAHRTCPALQIVAVEANPALIPVLKANLASHSCPARVVNGLAGLTDGEAAFYPAAEFWASSRTQGAAAGSAITVPEVDTRRLMAELRPTVLVMDIEGAEADLIPALDLSAVRRVIVELHPETYGPTGQYRLVAHLLSQGFEINDMPGWYRVFSFTRPDPKDSP